jgi:hypothetical protein
LEYQNNCPLKEDGGLHLNAKRVLKACERDILQKTWTKMDNNTTQKSFNDTTTLG